MAPTTRTRRSQRAAATATAAATAPAAPALPVADCNNLGSGDGLRSPNGEATEAGHGHSPDGSHVNARDPDAQRPWTPEPEPYDDDTYTAWGRKHFGEDWYQQRSIMLEERDIYALEDPVYKARQEALRDMEEERQAGKLPPRAMTWDGLQAWSRAHYGPVWCQYHDTHLRLEAESRKVYRESKLPGADQSKLDEAGDLSGRSYRHEMARDNVRIERDAELLAKGKTWREILSFPPLEPPLEPAEEDGPVYRSPSPSSDGSGFRTFPPTATKFHEQARRGPQPEDYSQQNGDWQWAWHGSANQWDWKWESEQWHGLEGGWMEGVDSPQD